MSDIISAPITLLNEVISSPVVTASDVVNSSTQELANSAVGAPLNAILAQLGDPRLTERAPTALGRSDIEFDGSEFVLVTTPG